MVVNSATKKKLIDLGFGPAMAQTFANDRKWDEIRDMSPDEIYDILIESHPTPFSNWDYVDKVALWRKLGRLEIKVVKDANDEVDRDRVYISVPYLSDEYQGYYNFRTGVLIPKHEGFRGLGSLFSRQTSIFDWHWVGPSNAVSIPKDAVGNDGYFAVMNQLQTKKLAKILRTMESNFLFPHMYESINRADVLSLWDDIPDDNDTFDGLGSLFG